MAKKILIVDDDSDTRYVLSLILKSEGYEVITAADGECALAVTAELKPDLIITDISMPRVNGIELTRQIRLKRDLATMPILAITAYGAMTMRNAMAAGASACARKPLVFAEFLPMIKNLLATSGSLSPDPAK
ncbi:MAG TPA: response regulator [Blastocatellia bacterium]|jgi:CheY-like chemotaxis protein|nr:response regulator [Blastocatellia bacterium]